MGRAVESWDHFNVIGIRSLQNFHQFCGCQVFTLIGVILIGRKGPGGIITAAEPRKIILRLELSLVIVLVPKVNAET